MALGSGVAVLSQSNLPANSHDPGLLEYVEAHDGSAAAFVEALGMHRHHAARMDPDVPE